MSDLAYWASILLWPAGVGVLVVAVYLHGRRAERRWQAADAGTSAGAAAVSLADLERRVRILEAAARGGRARNEAAE